MSIITEAGVDPKVVGFVYVAAFAPEVGQSNPDQYKEVPPPPNFVPEVQVDGFAYLNGDKFHAGFADDTRDAGAAFLRDSQVPIAMVAWRPQSHRRGMAKETQLVHRGHRGSRHRPRAATQHGPSHRCRDGRDSGQPRRFSDAAQGGCLCHRPSTSQIILQPVAWFIQLLI